MFRLYLITAWRNLLKNKLVATINITGLAIGISAAILATLFAYHELSYESYHPQSNQIATVFTYGDFGALKKIPQTFSPVADNLQENFAEIEKVTRTRTINGIGFQQGETPLQEDRILVTDFNFYAIFRVDFTYGVAPKSHENIALSESSAIRYFGNKAPLGQTLTIKIWGERMDFIVSGVFSDLPSNTHLEADFILPMTIGIPLKWDNDYNGVNYFSYVLLKPGTDLKALNKKILEKIEVPVTIKDVALGLVPVKRLHLHESISENNEANLYMLLIGGIITLLISCFNYINLSSIIFTTRMKEVGIKKSFGANKKIIFTQFIFDTGLTAILAAAIAILILSYILPRFNSMLSVNIDLTLSLQMIAVVAGIILLTVMLAGIYPALISSYFKPITLMRGNQITSTGMGKKRVSNILITLQFIVAVLLLQIIVLMEKQTDYMFRLDVLGYTGENVICLNGWEWGDLNTIKQQLKDKGGIEQVSWGTTAPALTLNLDTDWKSDNNEAMAIMFECEDDFLEVFNINLLQGRFFSEKFSTDFDQAVVINELTARELGLDNPVGEKMLYEGKQHLIVGLVDNFQAVPPIYDDMPLIIEKADAKENYLFVKVNPDHRREAHYHIEQVLRSANPEQPLMLRYYEDLINENSKTYIATFTVSNIFSFIIIINGMMGIFGLSYYVAQRRIKEVGIRKVCGASMKNLLWSLSKGFLLKFFLAFIIATPFIFFFGRGFLASFPRHIAIGPEIYVTGGILSLLMLLISSGWNLYKVSRTNPAQMLRHE
jgi:ABC-type antimicrobial peptide transport system permease subunit